MPGEWTDLGLRHVLQGLSALDNIGVRVGVVGHAAQKQESSGLTVAEVAYINEFGSGRAGIPARPFVKPALTPALVGSVATAVVSAVVARQSAHDALTAGGQRMAHAVRAKLADVTNSGGNKASTIRKKGIDTPLHETGKLSEAISYQLIYGTSAAFDSGFSADDYDSASY